MHNIDPERRKAWSSKGGKAAQAKGTARRWSLAEARNAGRLGALKRAENMRKRKEALEELKNNADSTGSDRSGGQDQRATQEKE